MKKNLILMLLFFVWATLLSAQITQEQADAIIQARMSNEMNPYTVFAKENLQYEGIVILTFTGENLELDYSCWVYFVRTDSENSNNIYLIVKESNGNLLEINVTNDEIPNDLVTWRLFIGNGYPIEIPFEDYSLEGTSCKWKYFESGKAIIINSYEELENYISCTNGSYPEIDFSKYTLLIARGLTPSFPVAITNTTLLIGTPNEYTLNVRVQMGLLTMPGFWNMAILTQKILEETVVLVVEIYH